MTCPACQEDKTRVADSRLVGAGTSIRRRRVCKNCGHRFSTVESVELLRAQVRKRNGSLQPFDREKLLGGLRAACKRRPIPEQTLRAIIAAVERDLTRIHSLASASGTLPEINSQDIGDLVLSHLKSVDPVAYVLFSSVYQGFSSVEEFERALGDAKRVSSASA